MKRLVAVIGPTAVGKTNLALQLARDFNGELINADSRQVYRFLNIGTAKIRAVDQVEVPQHILDIINPDEPFSLAYYQKLAYKAINNIQKRGKLPILVGGSGQYIWSVIEGWKIPEVPPETNLRQDLEATTKTKGSNALYMELQRVDPITAEKVLPNNVRRIIRALEIYKYTGKPASQLRQKKRPPFRILIIGLTADRAMLYKIIDSRVENMIERGLVEEVNNLLNMGYSLDLPSMSGIGYREMVMFIQGRMSLPDAIQRIKFETHKFARHQYAWFHLNDDRIHWFNICDDIYKDVTGLTKSFIENRVN